MGTVTIFQTEPVHREMPRKFVTVPIFLSRKSSLSGQVPRLPIGTGTGTCPQSSKIVTVPIFRAGRLCVRPLAEPVCAPSLKDWFARSTQRAQRSRRSLGRPATVSVRTYPGAFGPPLFVPFVCFVRTQCGARALTHAGRQAPAASPDPAHAQGTGTGACPRHAQGTAPYGDRYRYLSPILLMGTGTGTCPQSSCNCPHFPQPDCPTPSLRLGGFA
jgi:hypothetical protein